MLAIWNRRNSVIVSGTTAFNINYFVFPVRFYIMRHWFSTMLTLYKAMIFINFNHFVLPRFCLIIPIYRVNFRWTFHVLSLTIFQYLSLLIFSYHHIYIQNKKILLQSIGLSLKIYKGNLWIFLQKNYQLL